MLDADNCFKVSGKFAEKSSKSIDLELQNPKIGI